MSAQATRALETLVPPRCPAPVPTAASAPTRPAAPAVACGIKAQRGIEF